MYSSNFHTFWLLSVRDTDLLLYITIISNISYYKQLPADYSVDMDAQWDLFATILGAFSYALFLIEMQ